MTIKWYGGELGWTVAALSERFAIYRRHAPVAEGAGETAYQLCWDDKSSFHPFLQDAKDAAEEIIKGSNPMNETIDRFYFNVSDDLSAFVYACPMCGIAPSRWVQDGSEENSGYGIATESKGGGWFGCGRCRESGGNALLFPIAQELRPHQIIRTIGDWNKFVREHKESPAGHITRARTDEIAEYCRRDVLEFAVTMESRLRANDHKGGWENCDAAYLQKRMIEEVVELWDAETPGDVWDEAADVANFVMMYGDVYEDGCVE